MAQRGEDLAQIGMDGFSIIEGYMGMGRPSAKAPQKSRPIMHHHHHQPACYYTYQPQQSHVYYATPLSSTQVTLIKGSARMP